MCSVVCICASCVVFQCLGGPEFAFSLLRSKVVGLVLVMRDYECSHYEHSVTGIYMNTEYHKYMFDIMKNVKLFSRLLKSSILNSSLHCVKLTLGIVFIPFLPFILFL